jgi:iron complex outermembrane receptor protein
VNLAELPLDVVDHVEVYRGTTPLAFAQSAPGGVVNVVTRRPGTVPLAAASASYGSFDTRKADLALGASSGTWDGLAFAHYLGSAGDFLFTNDGGTPLNPLDDRTERRQNNAFNLGDLTARLGFHPAAPLSAALTADSFAEDQGTPGGVSVQLHDASLFSLRQLAHLEVNLSAPAGVPLDASASAYVSHQRHEIEVPPSERHFVPTDRDERTDGAGGQLLVRGALGAHQVPGVFLAASRERFNVTDRATSPPSAPERTRVRATLAGEDEVLLLGERLSLVPGLRWEIFHDDFPGAPGDIAALRTARAEERDFFSPRFGLRAQVVPGLTLLGNIGRYARVPNLQELFGNSRALNPNASVLKGNPNLRPEVAMNRDVGLRVAVPRFGLIADAALEYAYFDNTIDDLIALVQQSQTVVRSVNVSAASLRGHELAARARLWDRLGLIANYTHQRTRDESDRPSHGNELPGRPADEAYGRVELGWSPDHPLPLGAWAARAWPGRLFYEVNLIGKDFLDQRNIAQKLVPSRTFHGAGLELALPLSRVRVTFEVKNAGDERTQDVFAFPLPGRSLFATVSYGFGRSADAGD